MVRPTSPIIALLSAMTCTVPLPALAQPFAPGEQITLAIRYLGLPTGEGTIAVGQPAGDVWPVTFQARTTGLVGLLDVREHLTCLWDATTGLSRGSDLRALELGDRHVDAARFDRVAGTATVSVSRRDRRTEKIVAVPPDAHDLTSAIFWLRRQPLRVGDVYGVPVLAGTKVFTLTAAVEAAERIETPAGSFEAVRVRAGVALDGPFSTRRDVRAWFSDDARHVLIRLEAEFAVGSIVAELKRYRPGAEVAQR